MNKKNQSIVGRAVALIKGNPIVLLLVIAAIVVGCLKDNFFSWANFSNLTLLSLSAGRSSFLLHFLP